jgi:cell fate regulator YaaT (PSP1 superfamily)
MCCLNYEQDTYEKIRKTLPTVGSIVQTPYGRAEVIGNSVVKEAVKIKIKLNGSDEEIAEVKIEDLTLISGSYEDAAIVEDIKLELAGNEEDSYIIKELFKDN